MKILIVFDSLYGNTEKVARAVAEGFSSRDRVEVVPVKEATYEKMRGIELLVVGSPTQGGRPTKAVQQFLDEMMTRDLLKEMKVAVFDTGLRSGDLNFALKLLVKTIGYAASKMARTVTKKGGKPVMAWQGFFVKGKSGPLLDGELERAREWAAHLA